MTPLEKHKKFLASEIELLEEHRRDVFKEIQATIVLAKFKNSVIGKDRYLIHADKLLGQVKDIDQQIYAIKYGRLDAPKLTVCKVQGGK